MHFDAALAERERDATGADAELEGPSSLGQGGQELDCAFRIEERLVELVVDVGDALAVGRLVVFHRERLNQVASFAGAARPRAILHPT